MKVFLCRHGQCEPFGEGMHDVDRKLTGEGRTKALALAREMEARGLRPVEILTSPYVRCVETAEALADGFPYHPRVRVEPRLRPGGELQGLVAELVAGNKKHTMLVGHHPDLNQAVDALARGELGKGMKKGEMVALQLDDEKAKDGERIVERIRPKDLA